MKKFVIEVFKGKGKPGEDDEHIVRVRVSIDGVDAGEMNIAGGDFETAKGIAEGLNALVETGTDLMEFFPKPE